MKCPWGLVKAVFGTPTVLLMIALLCLPQVALCFDSYGRMACLSRNPASSSNAALQEPPLPDPSIAPSDISVWRFTESTTSAVFGQLVTIHAIVRNLGEPDITEFRVDVGIRNLNQAYAYNRTLGNNVYSGAFPNQSMDLLDVVVPWTVDITYPGPYGYEIWVLLDPLQSLAESNESNNWAVMDFDLLPLEWEASIVADKNQYFVGDSIFVTVTVTYAGTSDRIPYLPGVMLELVDLATGNPVPGSASSDLTTTDYGTLSAIVTVPVDTEPGLYAIRIVILGESQDSADEIQVIELPPGPWAPPVSLIVGAVAALAISLFAVLYVLDTRRIKK